MGRVTRFVQRPGRPTHSHAPGQGGRMWRVLVGVVLGVPLGWLAAELRRGWRAAQPVDGPPFAAELADAPRQPGEWL